MALLQHIDDKVRFDQQVENSTSYVLPFIEATKKITPESRILEVGTGEGGVLKPFIEKGAKCVGVDLVEIRIDLAKNFLSKEVASGKVEFLTQNIFDEEFRKRFTGYFDVIILKDVIEHVFGQQEFISHLKTLLRKDGQIFFGFPPWYMPFGGHQQVCRTKWASKIPWYHLLPSPIYRTILRKAGEHELVIKELLEIKSTGISIERFERIIKNTGLTTLKKQHYLINPIYKYKFKLKPRVQFTPITWIPFFRNFITTCVYYTVG